MKMALIATRDALAGRVQMEDDVLALPSKAEILNMSAGIWLHRTYLA